MSTVLFNPTNEVLRGMYSGIDFVIKSGEKIKVDDNKANHLLNSLTKKGLCVLSYGDNEHEIAEQGIARNLKFKKAQILTYNQANEARKAQGMSYLEPPEAVKEYSIELGIKLNEPYTMMEAEQNALSKTNRENAELRSQVNDLTDKLNQLLSRFNSQEEQSEETEKTPIKSKSKK